MTMLRPRLLPLILLLSCLPATAGDSAPVSPQKQAFTQRLDSLAQSGGLLEKVRLWQNAAEADPKAQITLPPANPQDKAAKPRTYPAQWLAAQGALALHQKMGGIPSGCAWAEFPPAVEVETLHARALWLAGQSVKARKMLEDIVGSNPDPGTGEAQVWLAAWGMAQWMQSGARKTTSAKSADLLPTWLGCPVDWATGRPELPPVAESVGKDGKAQARTPEDQAQTFLIAADGLVSQSEGEVQARAAVLAGDAFGLRGQWGEAQRAYGYAIALAHYLSAPKEYAIGESESAARRGVPGQVIAEAKTKQAKAQRIAEMARLSVEFVLYRNGHEAMLHGKWADAIGTFDRLLAVAEAKRQADHARMLARAMAEAQKEGHPVTQAQKAAEDQWQADMQKPGMKESPFEAAAKVYGARCRLALGQSNETRKGIADLQNFILQDKDGLYRGEALWTIARFDMDAGAFRAAGPWLEKLDAWVKQTRERQSKEQWDFAERLPGIAEAAGPSTRAPQTAYAQPDFWGNVRKHRVAAGQMVNEKTAPWYLDYLEEMAVKNQGFLAFFNGDYAKATACWQRLPGLNPTCKDISRPFENPNDCTRLLWSAEHKRMLAYPGEEGLFNALPALKARVLHAEFLYLTQAFDRSAHELREIIAIDDKVKAASANGTGGLPDPQRDYLCVTLGMVLARAGDYGGALAAYDQTLNRIGNTGTEHRAALNYVNIARGSSRQFRERAEQLEKALLNSGSRDSFVCTLRLNKATGLAYEGKTDEALHLLNWFGKGDGRYYERAQWQIRHGGKLGLRGE